jgi:hypothetical protein
MRAFYKTGNLIAANILKLGNILLKSSGFASAGNRQYKDFHPGYDRNMSYKRSFQHRE